MQFHTEFFFALMTTIFWIISSFLKLILLSQVFKFP